MAKSGIVNEDIRRKTCGSSSQFEVFVTKNRGRSKKKKEPKGGKENSKSKSKSRYKNVKCHYYNKVRHIQKYFLRGKKRTKVKKTRKKRRIIRTMIVYYYYYRW